MKRFLWTTNDYHRAIDAGVFAGIPRLELLNGEIRQKPRYTPQRAASAALTRDALEKIFSMVNAHVSGKHPVTIAPCSEPEPEVAVLRGDVRTYRKHHPSPIDVLLAVEVSDTALTFDRTDRAALYARAGIAEYWILNLNGRTLEVYRNPQNGVYPAPTIYDETMSVLPLNAPPSAVPIAVADFLP